MYQLTGERELAGAAVFWMDQTVARCGAYLAGTGADDRGGLAGPAGPGRPPWTGPGLLEGAAGIALALLSACEPPGPARPAWDQFLGISPVRAPWMCGQ